MSFLVILIVLKSHKSMEGEPRSTDVFMRVAISVSHNLLFVIKFTSQDSSKLFISNNLYKIKAIVIG